MNLGDKGYDDDASRGTARARGGEPEIPTEKSRRIRPAVNPALHATRARVERFSNRLENSRRVATRFDHTACSFPGFAKLVPTRQCISHVHAT